MHVPAPGADEAINIMRLTSKMLMRWGGAEVFREAEAVVQRGAVKRANLEGDWIRGEIARGTHDLKTALRILPRGTVESHCPCWANREQGRICSHVVALGICIARRQSDPQREQKYQAEQRRARRLAALDPGRYIQRAGPETLNAQDAVLELTLPGNWRESLDQTAFVTLHCAVRLNQNRLLTPEQIGDRFPLRLPKQDDTLLFVLEDICEGPAKASVKLSAMDFHNVLEIWRGRNISLTPHGLLHIQSKGAKTTLHVDLNDSNGEIQLSICCRINDIALTKPTYVVHGPKGWVLRDDNLYPLSSVLPLPYHALYLGPISIARDHLLRFAHAELPVLEKSLPVQTDFSPEMLTVEPGKPRFAVVFRGSPASLAASLQADYSTVMLDAGAPGNDDTVSRPDPDDPFRYTVRNLQAEQQAIARLNTMGFTGSRGDQLEPVTGTRQVLNVVGSDAAALRRSGWNVQFEGRIAEYVEALDMVVPVVRIQELTAGQSFEVSFDYESSRGDSLSNAEIQRALRRGDHFLEHPDGTLLLDADAITAMQTVFRDAGSTEGSRPGSFRMSAAHAPYVASALQSLDGVDIEQPPDWRSRCEQQNRETRIEPVSLPGNLSAILRPYQINGIEWLRFLEKQGFGGILADEMGLGKTLQALAWLTLPRHDKDCLDLPVLVVCPTSLVQNWAREAQTFVPDMRVLVLSGQKRHDLWEQIGNHDLVVTSYALMRRDLDRYLPLTFSVIVLDEAQHIKNRSTRNAQAAKKLSAYHRLVLTGTPVENSVSDLWSIMDFLMPGYLGAYERFREYYELPITRGDREGEIAQIRLRRKLHPFMLRRLKHEVAADLPPKLEKVSFCRLSTAQTRAYNALLEKSRRQVGNLVAEHGFERSRMQILAMLMKLRQTCCHLDLLAPDSLKKISAASSAEPPPMQIPLGIPKHQLSEKPFGTNTNRVADTDMEEEHDSLLSSDVVNRSAKTAHFLELLDEAIDGGHRMLVFSQFVSMLRILRRELEHRDIAYAYLDGSTQNRLEVVHRFNRQREMPVFLISLKAGGTGLNLTGADMVVHFDPWWNPAVEDQATDRAHRIGQKKSVYSIKLIAEHTIEEKVLALQKRKRAVIRGTVEQQGDVPGSLSWREIQELLNL